MTDNTPLDADDELRARIELRNRLKNLSIFRLGFGFDVFELIEFILADRKKHELRAMIDENNLWRTILAPSDDYNTADMKDFNDRVVELKQKLEKL